MKEIHGQYVYVSLLSILMEVKYSACIEINTRPQQVDFVVFFGKQLTCLPSNRHFCYGCKIEVRHFGCFLVVKKAIHNFEYLFKILIVYKVEIRGDLQKEKRNMFLFPARCNCDIVSSCFILNVEFYFI